MQGIFRKENTDKALKYGIYRHLPTYEKIIRNLVSFYMEKLIKKIKSLTIFHLIANIEEAQFVHFYILKEPHNQYILF